MSNQESSRPRETLACARAAVRGELVVPLLRDLDGAVVEVAPAGGARSRLSYFDTADAYRAAVSDVVGYPSRPEKSKREARFGVWIFGPERVETPSLVLRELSGVLDAGATVLIATEVPWPGKMLESDEHAEHTAEETAAAMVRAGFQDIERIVEGPFFRIWQAKKVEGTQHLALIDAETCLAEGDHASAERALENLTEQLDSVAAVHEYALLVAACHDLAERQTASIEALSEALALDPRSARAMAGLGRIAALRGDLESATDFFQSALTREPALVAALHGMAVVCEAKGDLDSAFRHMLIASDLRPRSHHLLSEASRLGNACGKLAEVARFLSHRLVRSPLTPFVIDNTDPLGPPEARC